LAASSALAEKTLNSGLVGDLESARYSAEKSAQTIVGQIDLSALGAKIGHYVRPKLSNLPIGSREVLNKKGLEVFSAHLDPYTRLKREVYSAKSIKNTEPEKYELILAKAKEEEAKVVDGGCPRLVYLFRWILSLIKEIEEELQKLNQKSQRGLL
jgi:hypothetical protein